MRIITMMMLLMGLINLVGCQHMAGNVVPQKGPTMETVYDSMEEKPPKIKTKKSKPVKPKKENHVYQKISNPELKMYIYPHLAGKEELPVPGYYTVFNAYTRDHYVLPSEMT